MVCSKLGLSNTQGLIIVCKVVQGASTFMWTVDMEQILMGNLQMRNNVEVPANAVVVDETNTIQQLFDQLQSI